MLKEKIRVAVLGYGQRGPNLMRHLLNMSDVDVVAVCDKYQDRTEAMVKKVEEVRHITPYSTQNYMDIVRNVKLDAAFVFTSWNMHIPITTAFMEAGVSVGFEVGGCDSLEECWELVRTHRKTGVECMMLENDCYSKVNMMLLNMVKKGVFGELVHCDAGYLHDLKVEILTGKENRQYRLNNYLHRNCENYPTHGLGPIAKLLNINHGNRMISLCSISSKAAGIKEYLKTHDLPNKELYGRDFAQGDVVTTMIKCAHGETIQLTLDTTLPHYFSENGNIGGTKARYDEKTHSFFFQDKDDPEGRWRDAWENCEGYFEQYGHPLWKEYEKLGLKEGHGGIDWLTLRAFVESVKHGTKPPIDAYDAASWMAVTTLSEASVSRGGIPVAIPDFTYGQWIEDYQGLPGKYSLDMICEDDDTPIYPD